MTIVLPMTLLPARPIRSVEPSVPVVVYRTLWSLSAHRLCRYLRREGVVHRCVDLDFNPDAEDQLRRLSTVEWQAPIVYVDGDWLSSPTVSELREALAGHGLI